jgi:hypothetical protein
MKVASILLAFALCSTPAAAHEGGHDARGVVTSVGPQELSIKTNHGEETFVLTPETQFVKDGSPATAQDLKASKRVVVHAKKKLGRLEAVKVQFKSAESPKKR